MIVCLRVSACEGSPGLQGLAGSAALVLRVNFPTDVPKHPEASWHLSAFGFTGKISSFHGEHAAQSYQVLVGQRTVESEDACAGCVVTRRIAARAIS